MDLTFFGSDQYSAIVLKHLFETPKLSIKHVITTRQKPVDKRGNPLSHSVEEIAIKHNLKLSYYQDFIKNPHNLSDQAIIASFGHILPESIIDLYPAGILCLHPSLLPQYRGATPVPTAIAMGEKITGVTLFQLTVKIDQGDILAQEKLPISPDDTSPTLLTKLFESGASLLTDYLNSPSPPPTPFQAEKLFFTTRFTRDTGFLTWDTFNKLASDSLPNPAEITNPLLRNRLSYNIPNKPLTALHDLVRALSPWPGVWTIAPGKRGDLRLTITSALPEITVKLPGKPNPITLEDLTRYYL